MVATDMILDQKHFKMQEHPLSLVGRKALGVNLSDLAAMGAEPRFALVSLGLPQIPQLRRCFDTLERTAGFGR